MPVPLSRRFALLVLIVVPLVYFRCRTNRVLQCPPPSDVYWKPVISVDEKSLKADPRISIVWDVEPEDLYKLPRTPSKRPVVITWRTQRPANLQLKFQDNSCVEPPKCKDGHCTAQVKPLAVDPKGRKMNRRCTYEMFLGTHQDEDADIVITPCCW